MWIAAHHSNMLGSKNIRIKIAFLSVQCAKITSKMTKRQNSSPFKQTFEICRLLSEGAAARANRAESYGCVDSVSPCFQSLLQHAVWPKIAVRLSVKKLFLQGVNRTVNQQLAAEGTPWHSSLPAFHCPALVLTWLLLFTFSSHCHFILVSV